MKEFIYSWGGALLCTEPIEGITQELEGDTAKDYGGKYFIAETLNRKTAEVLAAAVSGEESFTFTEAKN